MAFRDIRASAIRSGRFVPHVNIAVVCNNVAILAIEVDKINRRDVAPKERMTPPVDRDFSQRIRGI